MATGIPDTIMILPSERILSKDIIDKTNISNRFTAFRILFRRAVIFSIYCETCTCEEIVFNQDIVCIQTTIPKGYAGVLIFGNLDGIVLYYTMFGTFSLKSIDMSV